MGVVFLGMLVLLLQFENSTVKDKMEEVLKRDGYRVQTNFRSLIERADEYSKVNMFNASTQKMLVNQPEVSKRTQMDAFYTIVGSTVVDAIYVYDFKGNKYAASSGSYIREKTVDISEASWYEEVMKAQGGYCLVRNSGGFLKEESLEENYVSFIRVINDIDTQQPIGILLMNLNTSSIREAYTQVLKEYDTFFLMQDEKGEELYSTEDQGEDLWKLLEDQQRVGWQKMNTVTSQNERYGVIKLPLTDGWSETLALGYNQISNEYKRLFLKVGVLLGISTTMLILGTAYFSSKINRPLKYMLASMSALDDKKFVTVQVINVNQEINQLQRRYNAMLYEMQEMFERMEEGEKRKRKYELSLLQAQIRPHFLYNSFDAVSALALMNRTDDIFIIMQALGKYYRFSLHKGEEVILMSEEVKIIENYLIIMKYRFDGEFQVVYDMDETVMDIRILKLTIQPFVENAIFHGINQKKTGGMIAIRVKGDENSVRIQIEDNGAGMDEEQISKMLGGDVKSQERGFGVRSTVERLRLYYNTENIIEVQSTRGVGTVITLKIPKREEASTALQTPSKS